MLADFYYSTICRHIGFAPTAEQASAIRTFADFALDRNERVVMILRGSAGTGKTTLAGAIVKALVEMKQKLVLMAPTGRAAKVFAMNAGLAAFTIHRKIYRQKTMTDIASRFTLNANLSSDTLFIVDEASGVADPIMDAIMGTLSGANNKLLLCGNPTKTSGAFYDAFHASRAIFSCHTVNSEDSPRTNKQNISLLERKYGRNSNVFRVRVLGEFPVQEDDVFISLSIIEQAIMSEVDDFIGKISIGVDVARYGDDETVIATKIGNRISIPTIRQGQSLMQTVGDIVTTYFKLIQEYPDYTGSITVIIDDTGLGGGVTDRLAEVKAERQMYRLVIVPVNFASSPPNTDGDIVHYKDMTTYLWAQAHQSYGP